MDTDAVAQAVRHAHAETIAPRFGALQAGDVERKSVGEVVTVADRDCERLLGGLLRDVIDAPVLGEEAASSDPTLLDSLSAWDSGWIVDPIDGTANFADGKPDYAVMVAYLNQRETVASWIFQPEADHMAIAVRGAGATFDGAPVTVPEPEPAPAHWSGVIKDRFLPEALRAAVTAAGDRFGACHHGPHCAGIEYPALVAGHHHFLFYWRTLPWDHAPGVLYAEEAGCSALRPNGNRYVAHDPAAGLVVAHRGIAADVVARLLGDRPPFGSDSARA